MFASLIKPALTIVEFFQQFQFFLKSKLNTFLLHFNLQNKTCYFAAETYVHMAVVFAKSIFASIYLLVLY